MRQAMTRAGMTAALACALAVSAASGLALAAHLAVSSGGLPLGPLVPAVERQLSARTGGEVRLGAARLERAGTGGAGPVTLVLSGVEAQAGTEGGAGRAVSLPDFRLGLDTGAVMRGQVVPRRVRARGARVTVVRTEAGLELSGGEGALDLARLAEAAGERGFESLTIEDAAFAYRSEVSGAAFEASGARIEVWPVPGGYEASARLPLGDGVIEASAAVGEATSARLDLSAVPSSLLGALVPEAPLRAEDAALSGVVALSGLSDGGTARFDLALSEGVLSAGTRTVPLQTASASGTFDLAGRVLALEGLRFALGRSEGALSGTVDLSDAPAFSLTGAPLTLDLPIYEAPLRLDRLAVSGAFAERTLSLDALDLTLASGARLAGDLSLLLGTGRPGVTGGLRSDAGMTLAEVLAVWPDSIAPMTKRWVRNNVEGGRVPRLSVEADIPPGLIGTGARLGTDMLDMRFSLADAAVTYLQGMPPSLGAAAEARLTGTSFEIEAVGGTVGGAALERASLVQPKLGPQRTPVTIEASLSGAAQDLLAIADSPPLGYLARAQMSPDDFGGQGRFAFTLRRPLGVAVSPDEIEFAGEGAFEALGLTGLPAGIELSGGAGTLGIDGEALTVRGDAAVLGVPAVGTLTRRFAKDGEPPHMRLDAETVLTPLDADALGVPLRRYARGSAPATLRLEGRDRFETARVRVDLTDTSLRAPSLGLDKKPGSYGAFDARFVLPEAGGRLVADSLRLATPDVLVEGSAGWDETGGLARVELPRVFSDGVADLRLDAVRGGDGIALGITGRFADANGLVQRLLSGGQPSRGAPSPAAPGTGAGTGLPIAFTADLDRLVARGGAEITDFAASGRLAEGTLAEIAMSGGIAEGGRVSFEVEPDAGGVGRTVRLATDRSGALLTALFGIDSVTGGDASLNATAIAGGPVTGRFEAENLVLRDAPLVARLLSVGSLDGLAGVLNGEGLAFDKLSGALTLEDGTLTLADARLTGSSLGLSANGAVDLPGRRFDVYGAVAPAYGVNSFLGAIPGLGELFVSREGEGVVAFSYAVQGPIAEPTVSVNTLSALAPGVFRRIFEPIRPEKRTPEELLEAATEAAALREDRDTARDAEQLAAEEEAMERRAGREGGAPSGVP